MYLRNCKFSQLSKEGHYLHVALLSEKPEQFSKSYSEIVISRFHQNVQTSKNVLIRKL